MNFELKLICKVKLINLLHLFQTVKHDLIIRIGGRPILIIDSTRILLAIKYIVLISPAPNSFS